MKQENSHITDSLRQYLFFKCAHGREKSVNYCLITKNIKRQTFCMKVLCVCVCMQNKRHKFKHVFWSKNLLYISTFEKYYDDFFQRHGRISFDVFSQLYIFTLPLTHTSSLSFPFICISALPLWPNHSSLHHHHHVTLSKSPAVIYSSLFGWFHQLNTRRSRWADAMSWKEPDPITFDPPLLSDFPCRPPRIRHSFTWYQSTCTEGPGFVRC